MKLLKTMIIFGLLLLPNISFSQINKVITLDYNKVSLVNIETSEISNTNDFIESFVIINLQSQMMFVFVPEIMDEGFSIDNVITDNGTFIFEVTCVDHDNEVKFATDDNFENFIITSLSDEYFILLHN